MGRKEIWCASALGAALALATPAFATEKATAVLKDASGKEVGKVTLIAVPTGVLLDADLTAVPPGDHAFHIHAVGKCEPPDFKSAGGHFNPEEDEHGLMNEAGPHAGDMPNIHVPENGKLHIEMLNQMVSLSDGPSRRGRLGHRHPRGPGRLQVRPGWRRRRPHRLRRHHSVRRPSGPRLAR